MFGNEQDKYDSSFYLKKIERTAVTQSVRGRKYEHL